jgi:hypothetical protein
MTGTAHRPCRERPARAIAAVLLVALTLAAAGCGLRTAVRPPEDTAPIIPGKVEAVRESDGVAVHWDRADHSADGERLTDLTSFIVERKRGGDGAWERVATLSVVDQDKIRRKKEFTFHDRESGSGPVSYRVIAVCSDGQEGPPAGPAEAVEPPPKPIKP